MPNWCDNTIEILARKEINDEIEQTVNNYLGRRFDDASTRQSSFTNKEWTRLIITVRTAWGPPSKFINHVLQTYKNVLLKGHYWTEGGCGAADFEMSSDDEGHVEYHCHEEINQDYMTEEELEQLQEETTLEEIEFDRCRVEPNYMKKNKNSIDYLFHHFKENIEIIEEEGNKHLEELGKQLNKQLGREVWLPMLCTNESERNVAEKHIVERNALREQIQKNKKLALEHFVRKVTTEISFS